MGKGKVDLWAASLEAFSITKTKKAEIFKEAKDERKGISKGNQKNTNLQGRG